MAVCSSVSLLLLASNKRNSNKKLSSRRPLNCLIEIITGKSARIKFRSFWEGKWMLSWNLSSEKSWRRSIATETKKSISMSSWNVWTEIYAAIETKRTSEIVKTKKKRIASIFCRKIDSIGYWMPHEMPRKRLIKSTTRDHWEVEARKETISE